MVSTAPRLRSQAVGLMRLLLRAFRAILFFVDLGFCAGAGECETQDQADDEAAHRISPLKGLGERTLPMAEPKKALQIAPLLGII